MPKILSEARQYELMVIFGADKGDDVITKQLDAIKKLITEANGKILLEDVWGRRDLAYKIKGQDVGYYVVINFKGDSAKMKELRDVLRIDQSVIRSLLIKVPDDHIPTKTTEADLDFSKKVKVKDEKPVEKEPIKETVKVKEEPIKQEKAAPAKKAKKVEEPKEVVEEKEEKKPVKKEKKKEEVMDDLDRKLKAIMDDTDIDISI